MTLRKVQGVIGFSSVQTHNYFAAPKIGYPGHGTPSVISVHRAGSDTFLLSSHHCHVTVRFLRSGNVRKRMCFQPPSHLSTRISSLYVVPCSSCECPSSNSRERNVYNHHTWETVREAAVETATATSCVGRYFVFLNL